MALGSLYQNNIYCGTKNIQILKFYKELCVNGQRLPANIDFEFKKFVNSSISNRFFFQILDFY
jgi:hypothetical protein